MLRPLLMLSIMGLVAGCASSTTTGQSTAAAAQGQGTGEGTTINCSGADAGWVFCYRSASQVCGLSGYTILSRQGSDGPAAAGNETRIMVIRCK